MKKVVVLLANGFEEIEAVTLIDVLRRGNLEVFVVSLRRSLEVKGANGIVIKADIFLKDINLDKMDMLVLPGGVEGTFTLATNDEVQDLIKKANKENKLISAICAAPIALHTAEVLPKNFTCYPLVSEKIKQDGYTDKQNVIEEGNIITSKGPATAMDLGLYLVKKIQGEEMYQEIKEGLLA